MQYLTEHCHRYLALPWQGGGGPFLVHSLSAFGRLDAIPNLFQGHSSAVQDLDFSPFEDEIIASASVRMCVLSVVLQGHNGTARGLALSSFEDDFMVSASARICVYLLWCLGDIVMRKGF